MQQIAACEDIELPVFQHRNYHLQDIENDIDPDNNFYNVINDSCNYYSDDQFNNRIKTEQKLSIIHFNSRSLYANFDSIKQYLQQLSQTFNVIALSETWLNKDKGIDFEINGYEMVCKNRENKNGGGVALFVDKKINYKLIETMSTVMDNMFECVTIEILMEKKIFW